MLAKASWMQCPLHNQKVNKPSFHGAPCQLEPYSNQDNLNIQSTVLTNKSVLVSRIVNGELRQQPKQNLLNSVFITSVSACVTECRCIGSCSSTRLCAGFLITGFCLQLLLITSLWHRMLIKGYGNNFSRTCDMIQIKYVLLKLCHLPQ